MNIGVRVHTTDHSGYHRHGCPFLSLTGKGVAHATGTAEQDPTELVSAAQPASHRPTGACNTTHIMTPSRMWAAGVQGVWLFDRQDCVCDEAWCDSWILRVELWRSLVGSRWRVVKKVGLGFSHDDLLWGDVDDG